MRKLFIVFLLLLPARILFSQQLHFVYIQSDNHIPFYARVGANSFSSSAAGYLIVPKLPDSSYEFILGFPKSTGPEWTFNFKVNKKDLGFLFKDFGEKGWGLFNIQSMDVIMGSKKEQKDKTAERHKSNSGATVASDPFSVLLAAAVSDSSIKETPVVIIDKKVETEAVASKSNKDSSAVALSTAKKPDTETPKTPDKKSSGSKTEAAAGVVAFSSKPDSTLTANANKKTPDKKAETNAAIPVVLKPDSALVVNNSKKTEETKSNVTSESKTNTASQDSVAKMIAANSNQSTKLSLDPNTGKAEVKPTNNPVVTEKTAVVVPAADASKKNTKAKTTAEKNEAAASYTKVKKMMERHSADGTELIYVDEYPGGKKDTVRILVPSGKETTSKNPTNTSNSGGAKFLDMTVAPRSDVKPETATVKKEEKKDNSNLSLGNDSATDTNTAKPASSSPSTNPNCKLVAGSDDLDQTRKKMISKTEEDDMIAVALKAFKQKCFTVDQVKILSYVFLKDPGKYKLFDVAFPYVSDPSNFQILENQLSDSYYINRFRALVQK
ncbi:MAG: hypothetical protein C5B52_14985 [Bacteroidetes bacterium]|nr:MAG: hypothetical protein C5B52_14985 [Bacteroidota bacterium]